MCCQQRQPPLPQRKEGFPHYWEGCHLQMKPNNPPTFHFPESPCMLFLLQPWTIPPSLPSLPPLPLPPHPHSPKSPPGQFQKQLPLGEISACIPFHPRIQSLKL